MWERKKALRMRDMTTLASVFSGQKKGKKGKKMGEKENVSKKRQSTPRR